jgi:hypothetical protein
MQNSLAIPSFVAFSTQKSPTRFHEDPENIWQFMRANWLSNRVFTSFDDIVDHCCYAWNTLIDQPWKIMSIARRDWALAGHSL